MLSRILGLAFTFAFLIAGCSSGPTAEQIEATVNARLTLVATPPVTIIGLPTAIPQPSDTPKPTSTPRPTSTPKPTATQEPAQTSATVQPEADAALKADRTNGVWLVGVDIAPGTWRNNGTEDNCYWKRSDKLQETIDIYASFGGGAVTILPSDFQFETHGCGTWTYLSN